MQRSRTSRITEKAAMKIFAHRGTSTHFPENTHSAIMAALKANVDGIEVDVQSALDDYVIIHDTYLDRTTNGKWCDHTTSLLVWLYIFFALKFISNNCPKSDFLLASLNFLIII